MRFSALLLVFAGIVLQVSADTEKINGRFLVRDALQASAGISFVATIASPDIFNPALKEIPRRVGDWFIAPATLTWFGRGFGVLGVGILFFVLGCRVSRKRAAGTRQKSRRR